MTKLPKTLLAISSTAFVIGLAVTIGNYDLPTAWTVAMPVSAIFFGGFLVTRILQDEMAKFDEDRRAQLQRINRESPATAVRPARAAVASAPGKGGLVSAHSNAI